MRHTLISKFDTLIELSNAFRSIRHNVTSSRSLTHPEFLIDDVYGVSYEPESDDLRMYCLYRANAIASSSYRRILLSNFSTEDQIFHRKSLSTYISLNKEIEALKDVIRKEFIGKTVIRLGCDDEASVDEKVEIIDLNFSEIISFVIESHTSEALQHVIPHYRFKELG